MKTINEVVKKCELIEGVGAKSGKPYLAIQVELLSGYKELFFISNAMAEIINLLRK